MEAESSPFLLELRNNKPLIGENFNQLNEVQRSIFTAHVKVKHLNQQQKCPEAGSGCPFVTGYENNMRAHLKLVHKWEEITCMIPDCTFKTVVDQKMQDHLTKVHNARYDEATHALVCFA